MAIFHASTKTIGRNAGRSATAAAAYRAGVALVDERTGLVHDYTRRGGVVATEILIPGGGSAERNALWNAAEAAERRKDARTAREWVIALPAELDAGQRAALAREFAAALVERYGVAVDLAIHQPDREGDNRNHHAHLLTTTRQVSRDPSGALVLGDKADIELSDTKRRALGLGAAAGEITSVRELWEQLANRALERAGSAERIDSRSLAAQGIDREATQHLGPAASEMERRGVASDRGDGNRQAAANNAQRAQIAAEIIDLKAERERRARAMAGRWAAAAPPEAVEQRDPLDRFRERVKQAEREGDPVDLVQRRAELAAAADLVQRGEIPAHHAREIGEAGTAAGLAYLRGDLPPAEPRRAPETGDRRAGVASGRAAPERAAVSVAEAVRAELEREQQRRDAERQARDAERAAEREREAREQAAREARRDSVRREIAAAQEVRAGLEAERRTKQRTIDAGPLIEHIDVATARQGLAAAEKRLEAERSRGWLGRLWFAADRREAEQQVEAAEAAVKRLEIEAREMAQAALERRAGLAEIEALDGLIAAIDREMPDLRVKLADASAVIRAGPETPEEREDRVMAPWLERHKRAAASGDLDAREAATADLRNAFAITDTGADPTPEAVRRAVEAEQDAQAERERIEAQERAERAREAAERRGGPRPGRGRGAEID